LPSPLPFLHITNSSTFPIIFDFLHNPHTTTPIQSKDELKKRIPTLSSSHLLSPQKKQETPSCLPFDPSKGIREEFSAQKGRQSGL
jgi:hypothetical protein